MKHREKLNQDKEEKVERKKKLKSAPQKVLKQKGWVKNNQAAERSAARCGQNGPDELHNGKFAQDEV